MSREKRIDWSEVDWSKKTTEIVRETGAKQPAVSRARRRYAPDTLQRQCEDHDWASVDWKKTTGQIAKELGVKGAQVSTMRRRYAPRTLGPESPTIRRMMRIYEEEDACEREPHR